MYAIVTKVVDPARISVFQLVPSSANWKYPSRLLRKNFLDHIPAEIGELFVAPVMQVEKLILVEAQSPQNGRVE